jgi:type IV pilus assembly protein PilY1
MSTIVKNIFAAVLLVANLGMLSATYAAPGDLPVLPPHSENLPRKPMIMLNLSRDHQLHYRAYNEYSDLDGDSVIDRTYKHSITYYGYFDSRLCYRYQNSRFEPVAAVDAGGYCSGDWNGNFLNWSTMTRMDVVRKILYGGFRSTDTAAETVLERQYLPMDAHSFAKYYRGSDIAQLTPFNETEITICNTTIDAGGGANIRSQTNTNPPLMRVARGNYELWNANERFQCYWLNEKNSAGQNFNRGGNGNSAAVTGFPAAGNSPDAAANGLKVSGNGPDYNVRVVTCDANVNTLNSTNGQKCKAYGSSLKPTGLLHEYGENEQAEFGLMTGSYDRNISGGVLRSNMGSFRNEVNVTTNGTFTNAAGIVRTLNRLRIYGYGYTSAGGDNGSYLGSTDIANGRDNCPYQLIGLSDGRCSSWGNPIGEIFLESLRYLGGKTANTAFTYDPSGTREGVLGLSIQAWVDPFAKHTNVATRVAANAKWGKPECRPINAINFNASAISYDGDQWGSFSDISATAVGTLVNSIGTQEGINNTKRFAGPGFCTAKDILNMADIRGLCPDAPTYQGSFNMSGAAFYANTNRIRTDIPAGTEDRGLKVKSYGVALATGTPRIEIRTPGSNRLVVIQPSYLLGLGGYNTTTRRYNNVGGGTLVDFRVVSETQDVNALGAVTRRAGRFLVIWEDSEQGGDYDQDASGLIEYEAVGDTIKVRTLTFADATANPQGFGYTISGTDRDGVHFHSGILGFRFDDPSNLPVARPDGTNHPNVDIDNSDGYSGGCVDCRKNQGFTEATYTASLTTSAGQTLQDPMWYAAKYGGFVDAIASANNLPDLTTEWDAKKQDGTPGADGIPDTFFYAVNPAELERSLRVALNDIVQPASAAPAFASGAFREGNIAVFSSYRLDKGAGFIEGYVAGSDGFFTSAPWKAHEQMLNPPAGVTRTFITNSGQVALPFTWASLPSASPNNVQALLNTGPGGSSDGLGEARVAYLRGDRTNEIPNGTQQFRERAPDSIMGAITNSQLWVMPAPRALFSPVDPTYTAFKRARNARAPLVFAGTTDGMLHAFRGSDGAALFSYTPGKLASRLAATTYPGAPTQAMVDGSPFAGDVKIGSDWKSYVFGALGRGGHGIYALDVTSGVNFSNDVDATNAFAWEFTDQHDADLGNILSTPILASNQQPSQIVKLNNGRWAVIMPNGYRSDAADGAAGTGKAALFILYAEGPSPSGWSGRYVKLETGAAGAGPNNGLSGVLPIDEDGNGTADIVYAGDLKGNLWKFIIRSNDSSDWRAALTDDATTAGRPLFQARTAGGAIQPITATPTAVPHPFGGYMVGVGTGQSIDDPDYPNTRVDSLYGVWDGPNRSATVVARSTLVQQVLTTSADGKTRAITNNPIVDWTSTDGWFIDLPAVSETLIFNPFRIGDATFLFNSLYPDSSSTDCNSSNSGFLMLLDAFNGGPSDVRFEGAGRPSAVSIAGGSPIALISTGSQVRIITQDSRNLGPSGGGAIGGAIPNVDLSQSVRRIFWREIPGVKTCNTLDCN